MADSEDEDAPPERDVKDFNFKQMRKIRMFESPTDIPKSRSSLLAASTKYGLTFVGCLTGIKVIKTEAIERINESDEGSMQNIVGHCPSSFIKIGHSIQFVGLSSDDLTLSVCYDNGNQNVMVFYDVPTLGSSNPSTAKFGEITLTRDEGVSVGNVLWNPGFPGIFAVCLSSGSLSVMELTETDEIKTLATLPGSVKANAICWSPEGKQLVVGHRDGSLTQYSQALDVKNEIECPEVFIDDPHSVADLLWITATLFAAVYSSLEDGDTPKFQLLSVPKNEPRTITNFDDIYYVMSEEREQMYYLKNITEWSMVVSACSNGYESAVIGKYGGEVSTTWEKWNFEETGRAEMPLTNNNDETFPMGLAFDFSSTRPVIEGEKRLSPAPIMMLLSTDGVLCPFYMVNQTPNTDHSIIKPMEPLPLPRGQRKAIVSNAGPLTTATPGLAPKGSVSSAPRTAGDLPVGAFAFVGTKETVSSASGTFSSGLSGTLPAGASSFASSKQPVSFSSMTPTSATPSSAPASTFSFTSSKQNVTLFSGAPSSGTPGDLPAGIFSFGTPKQPVSSSGNAPFSAFLSTNQKQPGLKATLKLPTETQIPVTESGRPLANSPQLVKPTPSSRAQPVTAGLSSFQSPLPMTTSIAKGDDKPKTSSSVPSQLTGQGLLTQPKATLAKAAAPKAPATRQDLYKEEGSSLPELKPSLGGFKFPEQSTPTEGVRQEPTRKTGPVSKGNVIDASVSENIQEAISHFNTEMAKLCDNVKAMQSNCCLRDDDKDLASLRRRTEDVASKLAEIKSTTKEQHKDIDDEKRKLFEAFEMLEDARIRQERKSDPRYVQLLKSRALDPVNASKMRDIRNLHQYLEKTLREVNMVIDEQWNKENERKRSIQRPALVEVYQTLKVHHKIAQDQAAKLEQITQEMKNRKLLSASWQQRSPLNTTSLRDDLSSVRDPFAVSKQELKSPIKSVSALISPQKQAQLRSMFQKRRTTPVRRSTVIPSTVTKTPVVKPNRAEVPFYSSTPAVKSEDTAEGSKGCFSFSDPIPEEIKVSDDDGSLSEDEYEEEEPLQEKELEHLDAVHKASASGPGPSPKHSDTTSSAKGSFSLGNSLDEAVLKKPPNPVRMTAAAAESSHAKSIPQPTVVGAFSAVDKSVGGGIMPPSSQPTKVEPALAPSGLSLPATKAEPTTSATIPVKSDFIPNVKVISTETPPNIAAAMAAMSRASAPQGAAQSGSNLDPSASIEPVTLVTYKPQAQGGTQPKDYDAENNAAKAIANAALMAATVEAQKSSSKPQCSTEFVFKSSDSSKPGPPVVTFKPPTSPPQMPESASKVAAAPNVTVNPTAVFKPAFPPAVPSVSTASITGGLQKSFTGPQAAGSFSFTPPNGGLPSFGPSSVAASTTPSAFSFSSKAKDTGPSQRAATNVLAPSAAKPGNVITAPTAGIIPSPRVSRNLFAAGSELSSAAAAATSGEKDAKQEDKKEALKTLQVTTANPSIASSTRITTSATGTPGFSFSAPMPAGEGFFKNLNLSTATIAGGVFGGGGGGGDTSSNPPSILSSLMRASVPGGAAGNTSNLFGAAPTAASKDPASTSSTLPGQVSLPSKGTPSENKDASIPAAMTPPGFPVSASAGGVFAQALSESSKSSTVSSTTPKTLPVTATARIFGASATTPAFSPAGLFDLSLGGAKASTTTPSTTTVASNLLGLSAGTASAFSATSTTSPFFPSITPVSTNASAPAGGSPLTSLSPPTTTTTVTSPSSKDSSTSATSAGGLFSKVSSTASPFGVALGTVSSGAGSVGAPSATTTAGSLFAAATPSTAFAPTPVFGAASGGTFGSSPAPFSSPGSSQGSMFGSAAVFGSSNTTAGTASGFGAPTSAGFSAASKSAENGIGFGGFGLGGQASSQASKANPFGVAQGFGASNTTQSSLFGGKSGVDVFKMTDSPKPAFGSGPFSQSAFGTQSSGGFSGSFSAQGGTVAASGFGFGASSPSGTTGFGSPQPFGSPSAGGSVFGGAPSFGSAPSFGGAPAFGSSPQGGLGASPSSGVFGSAPSGGFGQSQGSPTFGALATQSNLPSFGAVAGMPGTQGFGGIQQQQQAVPSFGSFGGGGGGGSQSPSGASFSQWR